jgi:excisionase family DNA binding protein
MTEDIRGILENVAKFSEVLTIMSAEEMEVAMRRIKRIDDFLCKYGDLARVVELAEEMQSKIYQCKTVFTIEEAARYVGHTKSLLYKWTSNREITHYKPTGKAIYIDRSELDDILRSNPIYSYKELDRMNKAQELERKQKRRRANKK